MKLQDFKDLDYRIYQSHNDWSKWLIQKKFVDEKGIKYFINIYLTDYRLWKYWDRMPKDHARRCYSIYLQFETVDGLIIDVSFPIDKIVNIEDIEEKCKQAWERLEGEYYEVYDY